MNSPREMIESLSSSRIESVSPALSVASGPVDQPAAPLAPARWNWADVRRVLVIRLRSIGDTVLATPTLFALRRFLPQATIDVVLEDWVGPVLSGSDLVDR